MEEAGFETLHERTVFRQGEGKVKQLGTGCPSLLGRAVQ